jgi:hypothetical protein
MVDIGDPGEPSVSTASRSLSPTRTSRRFIRNVCDRRGLVALCEQCTEIDRSGELGSQTGRSKNLERRCRKPLQMGGCRSLGLAVLKMPARG